METISLKLEWLKPTDVKKNMYQQMTELNTSFSNWLPSSVFDTGLTTKI